VTAAPAAIIAGTGDGDEVEEESDGRGDEGGGAGRGDEGGGAKVEFGTKLENIEEEIGKEVVAAGADVVAGAAEHVTADVVVGAAEVAAAADVVAARVFDVTGAFVGKSK
jgi:hypothetical protein